MSRLQEFIVSILRRPVHFALRPYWRRLFSFNRRAREWWIPFIHRPSLLILDEATSALDVGTEAQLLEALRGLSGKLTMVVAAQRLSAVANCDQLIDLATEIPAVVSVDVN